MILADLFLKYSRWKRRAVWSRCRQG